MKILVVRVGRFGDMVMITPSLCAILDNFPNAELCLLTGPEGKGLLKNFDPRLNNFIIYDRKSLWQFSIRKKIQKLITNMDFDYIYCFDTNPSFLELFKGSKAKVHRPTRKYDGIVHFAKRLLDTVSDSLNKKLDYPYWLPVSNTTQQEVNSILSLNGISDKTLLIALHPSYSAASKYWFKKNKMAKFKDWGLDNWGKLAIRINEFAQANELDLKVAVSLPPNERRIGEQLQEKSNNSALILSLGASLENYLAFLKRANLFITPDTGPMHMANAVGTPLIAMYCHHNPKDCGPFSNNDQNIILRTEEVGNPEIGLSSISTDILFSAFQEQLKRLKVS